ncbi:MAG: hypothetical protein OEM93_11490, partial [Rhodospirillales bacterium]|nr:hypothetical protein [Rhodospirillales bacterium]
MKVGSEKSTSSRRESVAVVAPQRMSIRPSLMALKRPSVDYVPVTTEGQVRFQPGRDRPAQIDRVPDGLANLRLVGKRGRVFPIAHLQHA